MPARQAPDELRELLAEILRRFAVREVGAADLASVLQSYIEWRGYDR